MGDMHSKHAFILALMAGAGALLVVLGGFLSLEFLQAAEPYLSGRVEARAKKTKNDAEPVSAPQLITKLDGSSVQIVELDKDGLIVRTIYSSDLKDQIADFSLFAVPQTNYDGKAYVLSVQDAEGSTLIVYPLTVATGKISPAVINVASAKSTISPEQNRVAVINTTPANNITAYDVATGAVLASWTLAAGERLNEAAYTRAYTGGGVRWTSNSCFDHAIWTNTDMQLRTFCIENTSN